MQKNDVDESNVARSDTNQDLDSITSFQQIELMIFPIESFSVAVDLNILISVVKYSLKEITSDDSIKLHASFLKLVETEIQWIDGLSFYYDPNVDYRAVAKLIRKEIAKNQLIGRYYLLDGILAQLEYSITLNNDLFKRLKKITILTAIALLRINISHDVVEDQSIVEAIRNIRLFSNKNRTAFSNYISSIPFESRLEDIIESIHEQMDNTVQESSVKRLIANLHQILNRLYSHASKREISSEGEREQKENKIETIAKFNMDTVEVSILSDVSWQKRKKAPEAWSEEEQLGNPREKSTYLLSETSQKPQDLSSRFLQAKSIAHSIEIRTQSLPCSASTFSGQQIKQVVRILLQKVDEGSIAAQQLMIQLITGMSLSELNAVPISLIPINTSNAENNICWFIQHKKIWQIQRIVKVANSTIHQKLKKLLPPADLFIKLPLPEVVWKTFKTTALRRNCKDEIANIFVGIRKETGICITQIQISNFLKYWLQQTRVDQAIAGVLTGKTAKQCAPMAYAFIPANKIQAVWQEYMAILGCSVNIDISDKSHGSRLYPNTIAFEELIQFYQQTVQSYYADSNNHRYIVDWHNGFIRHCLLILNMSTGARPVTDMYGFRQDYCLKSRLIRISDKEARSVPCGRLLPLTETAVQQLRYLERHLEYMAAKFQFEFPELAIAAQNALSSKAPFLFRIDLAEEIESNVSFQIEFISPTSLAKDFDALLPFPVNWHRHAVSSYLRSMNVSSVLIAALLGHEDMGHEYLHVMSGASFRELFVISDVLDGWFSKLKLECIAGW